MLGKGKYLPVCLHTAHADTHHLRLWDGLDAQYAGEFFS